MSLRSAPPPGRIEVQHVWKRFHADRGRSLLRDQIRLGRISRRGWRWALTDISFAMEPGDSLGLIGVNGSGKSTLLKILNRVMYPHTGSVVVGGRVGALIEVRAGIHPDLTGRENVYLYGSLLGLRRADVQRRFDEIVAFAEVTDAIDRQVKFYSSGMQMRLGFAVAAFLEPDALLVDEVLAVGDATFQQRCLDRMRTVLAQGTTLVFVSHDLAAVEAVCARGLWLHDGEVKLDGSIRDVLVGYRQAVEERAELTPHNLGPVRAAKVDVVAPDGPFPRTQEPVEITLFLEADKAAAGDVFVGISEGPASPMFVLRRAISLKSGETRVTCFLPQLPLPRGRYYAWAGIFGPHGLVAFLPWHPVAHFDVFGPELDVIPRGILRLSPIHVEASWRIDRLD